MRSVLGLAVLGFAAAAAALDARQYNYPPPDSSSSSSTSATASASATAAAAAAAMPSGQVCTPYLCINGVVNGSNVHYTLQSQGKAPLGWMAMGFGTQMANTPMVIMWNNSDGSITLSQRMASAEVMPTVVSNPPRNATTDMSAVSLTGSKPQFAFTIPKDSSSLTPENIIWAFGTTNPGSNAIDATLVQHIDSAATQLSFSSSSSGSSGSSSSSGATTSPTSPSGAATLGASAALGLSVIAAASLLMSL